MKIAHIVIPKEHVNLDNYHTGHCISSVVHHNDVFEPEYHLITPFINLDLLGILI